MVGFWGILLKRWSLACHLVMAKRPRSQMDCGSCGPDCVWWISQYFGACLGLLQFVFKKHVRELRPSVLHEMQILTCACSFSRTWSSSCLAGLQLPMCVSLREVASIFLWKCLHCVFLFKTPQYCGVGRILDIYPLIHLLTRSFVQQAIHHFTTTSDDPWSILFRQAPKRSNRQK